MQCFYIGETRRSLSDCMNGHSFTTTVSNSDLLVAIHTQSHQIPFQDCCSVIICLASCENVPTKIFEAIRGGGEVEFVVSLNATAGIGRVVNTFFMRAHKQVNSYTHIIVNGFFYS